PRRQSASSANTSRATRSRTSSPAPGASSSRRTTAATSAYAPACRRSISAVASAVRTRSCSASRSSRSIGESGSLSPPSAKYHSDSRCTTCRAFSIVLSLIAPLLPLFPPLFLVTPPRPAASRRARIRSTISLAISTSRRQKERGLPGHQLGSALVDHLGDGPATARERETSEDLSRRRHSVLDRLELELEEVAHLRPCHRFRRRLRRSPHPLEAGAHAFALRPHLVGDAVD